MKTITRKSGIWHYVGYSKPNKVFYVCVEKAKSLTFGECSPKFKPRYVISFKKRLEVYYVGNGGITTPRIRHEALDHWIRNAAKTIPKNPNTREGQMIVKGKFASISKLIRKMAKKNKKGLKHKFSAVGMNPSTMIRAIKYKKLLGKSIKIPKETFQRITYLQHFELYRYTPKEVQPIMNLPLKEIPMGAVKLIASKQGINEIIPNKKGEITWRSYKEVLFECRFQKRFPYNSYIYQDQFRYVFQNFAEADKKFWSKCPKKFTIEQLNILYNKKMESNWGGISTKDVYQVAFDSQLKDLLK